MERDERVMRVFKEEIEGAIKENNIGVIRTLVLSVRDMSYRIHPNGLAMAVYRELHSEIFDYELSHNDEIQEYCRNHVFDNRFKWLNDD